MASEAGDYHSSAVESLSELPVPRELNSGTEFVCCWEWTDLVIGCLTRYVSVGRVFREDTGMKTSEFDMLASAPVSILCCEVHMLVLLSWISEK